MKQSWLAVSVVLVCAVVTQAQSQKVAGSLRDDMRELVQTPAVPGYEQELAGKISSRLKAYSPRTDNLGDVIVTVGSGAPHRLLVAPMDEPGFVISGITDDGYLRVQRLPQNGTLPLFNELYSAQPVKIGTAQQQWIWGAVGGLSIHLQPGRQHPPSAADLDDVYVDIGAASSKEARATGADLLSPMAIDRTFYEMGNGNWASPAIGDRFGDAALLEVLRRLDPQKLHGTLTVAFVGQQWADSRGLNHMLQSIKPDELIYVGRLVRAARPAAGTADAAPSPGFTQKPGSGVLVASANPQDALAGMAAEMKELATKSNVPLHVDFSARFTPATARGSLPNPPLPERTVHLAVATAWPCTPAEFLDAHDVASVAALIETYLQGQAGKAEIPGAQPLPAPSVQKPSSAPGNEAILRQLVEAYGVSGGHEGAVKETIARLLPPWAKTETDSSGNLILRWGQSPTPSVLVVAHQDEIGYEVHSILPDGRLDLEQKGGGVLAFFMGHAALVHSANGMHPGVLELPDGWEKSDFQWPRGARLPFRLDIGAASPEQVAQMGIKTGDYVTIPKQYHKLAGMRASARAFDDRVGCAALISAVWALGPDLGNRNITFVWSTAEELGLLGAADVAKRLGTEGHAPEYVFAVDTFVSADSPLESKRFGDAILGQGFVVRAVDNSNIVPHTLVEKVLSMAHDQHIAAQYGVTGGGNDGSAFVPYGSIDIALGWPLRYSHSPGEVIDTRDLDALAGIIAQVARGW
jgi:putative aminopeptidase FrvX